jgi:hypothetical protein
LESRSDPFDNCHVGEAAAFAHRLQAVTLVAVFQRPAASQPASQTAAATTADRRPRVAATIQTSDILGLRTGRARPRGGTLMANVLRI